MTMGLLVMKTECWFSLVALEHVVCQETLFQQIKAISAVQIITILAMKMEKNIAALQTENVAITQKQSQ